MSRHIVPPNGAAGPAVPGGQFAARTRTAKGKQQREHATPPLPTPQNHHPRPPEGEATTPGGSRLSARLRFKEKVIQVMVDKMTPKEEPGLRLRWPSASSSSNTKILFPNDNQDSATTAAPGNAAFIGHMARRPTVARLSTFERQKAMYDRMAAVLERKAVNAFQSVLKERREREQGSDSLDSPSKNLSKFVRRASVAKTVVQPEKEPARKNAIADDVEEATVAYSDDAVQFDEAELAAVKNIVKNTRPENRTREQLVEMYLFFQDVHLFGALEPEDAQAVCRQLEYETATAEHQLFAIGDNATKFYIIVSGSVLVNVPSTSGRRDDAGVSFPVYNTVATLTQGQTFGDVALLRTLPRTATVVACERCEFFVLEEVTFRNYMSLFARSVLVHKRVEERDEFDILTIMEFARDIKFFHGFTFDVFRSVCRSMEFRVVPEDTYLFEYGDFGDEFFIIYNGNVDVYAPKKHLFEHAVLLDEVTPELEHAATLTTGQSFGELALLKALPRQASVRTVGQCEFVVVSRPIFLHSVNGRAKKILSTKRAHHRTQKDIENLLVLTQNGRFFNELDMRVKSELCRSMALETVATGEPVFLYGDVGSKFYVILSGTVMVSEPIRVHVTGDGEPAVEDQGSINGVPVPPGNIVVATLGLGDSFGEVALTSKSSTRNATIIAVEDCEFITISKNEYNRTIKAMHDAEVNSKVGFLRELPAFDSWAVDDMITIAASVTTQTALPREVIVAPGTPATQMYFIKSGQCEACVSTVFSLLGATEESYFVASPRRETHHNANKQHQVVRLALLGPKECFGDIEAVTSQEVYTATVRALTVTELLVVNTAEFMRLIERNHTRALLRRFRTVAAQKAESRNIRIARLTAFMRKQHWVLPSSVELPTIEAGEAEGRVPTQEEVKEFYRKSRGPLCDRKPHTQSIEDLLKSAGLPPLGLPLPPAIDDTPRKGTRSARAHTSSGSGGGSSSRRLFKTADPTALLSLSARKLIEQMRDSESHGSASDWLTPRLKTAPTCAMAHGHSLFR